jgi:hypothetical protein
MSRGDGRVMRAVERRLTANWTPVVVLAREVYDVEQPTRAQVEAVRRAVRRLVEQERAMRERSRHSEPTGELNEWGGPVFEDYHSSARTPWTAEEREANRRMAESHHERIKALRASR